MVQIFGYKLTRIKKDEPKSFVAQTNDDGAAIVSAFGTYGTMLDLDGTVRTEAELITKYREMALQPEIDAAIEDIVTEAIIQDDASPIVELLLEESPLPDNIKKIMQEEFENILVLLRFNSQAYDLFKRYYVDGRLFFHALIDEKAPQAGVAEVRYIDPRKIRKVREVQKIRDKSNPDLIITKTVAEYFIYNEGGFGKTKNMGAPQTNNPTVQGIKIAKDAIVQVVSGLQDTQGTMVLSYLQKAIRPMNQLRAMEDATLIYRICLVGNTRIQTPSGYEYIKDIKENDIVNVFTINGLSQAKVKSQWSNGVKDVYKVKSKHHSITGTSTHPVLVYDKKENVVHYVDIKDLKPKQHMFVYEKPRNTNIPVPLTIKREQVYKLLDSSAWVNSDIENKEKYIIDLAKTNNINHYTLRNFLYGNQYASKDVMESVIDIGIFDNVLFDVKYEGVKNEAFLPDYIDKNFARLFGFLLGDGCVSKNTITFAEGVDESQNKFYASLLETYFGNCKRQNSKTRKYSNWTTCNTIGAELFHSLGWISGAHNKRIPKWVFTSDDSIKSAFITGLLDADASIRHSKYTGKMHAEIELCNKRLIEDIKALWSSLGYASGHIRYRKKPAHSLDNRNIPETESWSLFLSYEPLQHLEPIISVEYVGKEEVWDLEIDHEKHNFIANEIVVHNSRAPERRVFYIDVGNLPKAKAEQHLRDIMVKHKNRIVYDASSGEIRDDRRYMCYALDTKIPLLDGRTLTLQEIMSEYENGKTNWVYSCDPVTGKFVPGPISWAGITKRNSQVVKVTFDNGKSVVCTPDHKFPVWGKGFIEAKDLIGESIIPGYRRMKSIHGSGNEYEQIYKNDTKSWEYTHREVSKWKDIVNLREEYSFINNNEVKNTIHHKDFNRYNNNPNNLVSMGWHDHMQYHTKFCNNEELRQKSAEIHSLVYTKEIYDLIEQAAILHLSGQETVKFINDNIDHDYWMAVNENKILPPRSIVPWKFLYRDLLKICKNIGYKHWSEYSNIFKEQNIYYEKTITSHYIKRSQNKKWKEKLSLIAKNRKSSTTKTWKITTPNGQQHIIDNLNDYCRKNNLNRTNIKGDFGSKGFFAELLYNHKAISVEWLDEKIDVGCITIDKDETYHSHHTYLLDVGVYTKNTMLEDYWLPRRGDGKTTEITTLPGGQNLGELADVEYFQKRLYNSLNVPITRLDPERAVSIGRATEITRDEIKFARFIDRLRLKFSDLFVSLLEKQLILKMIITPEDWDLIKPTLKFKYARDNYWSELKDAEILTTRLQLIGLVNPFAGIYYSHVWIRKNILKQTDEDILGIDEEIAAEMQIPQYNPMLMPQPLDAEGQQMQPVGPFGGQR